MPQPAALAVLLAALCATPLTAAAPGPAGGVRARPGADVPSLSAQRAAARAGLVERLNQVASWCNEKELFLERDRIWRKVLELAPDDPEARKGLRYARNVDGTWKEPAPREVKNIGKKWLEKLPEREVQAAAAYGDALLALAQAPERSEAERAELLDELRTFAPDHAGLHALLGDVRMGDRWVLPETAVAKERRGLIKAAIKAELEGGPQPRADQALQHERALGAEWRAVLQTENVRVLSTGGEDEALRIAKTCEAVTRVLDAVLGGEPFRHPGAYTIYVLANPGEREVFLQRLPGVSEGDRARLQRLDATGIPGSTNVAVFCAEPANRLDAAVRHTLARALGLTLGLSPETAWAYEGVGIYLTREMVGTRLTWFVAEDADTSIADLRGKLMVPEANWIQEAYALLTSAGAVPLADVMARDLTRLDVPGALTGYALTAYLLEGRPKEALEFLRRAARREEPATIAREVLQSTPAELQERVVRWLSERR